MNKKLLISITAVFVLAILCTALLPMSVAQATQYGSGNSDSFWYYGAEHLNVTAMKTSIAGWIGKADKSNPVIIGVIDTGVNVDHDVFEKTNTIYTIDGKKQGYNSHVAQNVKNPTHDQLSNVVDTASNSHGTAVASIMAMLIYDLGLQDYIKLYPIQASTGSSDGLFDTGSVVKALKFIDETKDTVGIDVANIAVAGYKVNGAENYLEHQDTFLKVSSDCVLVVAAGNNGLSTKVDDGRSYPASLEGVLSVMAYDKNGNKNDKSNYGDYDLIVPGREIWTAYGTNSSYKTMDGTSMASAFVSVVSAIVTLRERTANSNTNAALIARHICTSSKANPVSFDGYSLSKFNGYASVHNQITDTYLDPTGVKIYNNHQLGRENIIYRGQYKDLTLTAELLPYGNTNPSLAENVVWTQTEVLSRPILDNDGKETGIEEYEGETVELGKGKAIQYSAEIKGKYIVKATYKQNETVMEDTITFIVSYVEYSSVAGILNVKPVPNVEGSTVDDGYVYEFDKVTFYLSGSEVLDPTIDIKWFVNGEHVHTGETFEYKTGPTGKYEISAQYGDNRPVERVYVLEVKSGFLRPAVWISFTAVVGAGIIALAIVLGIKFSKKKE